MVDVDWRCVGYRSIMVLCRGARVLLVSRGEQSQVKGRRRPWVESSLTSRIGAKEFRSAPVVCASGIANCRAELDVTPQRRTDCVLEDACVEVCAIRMF